MRLNIDHTLTFSYTDAVYLEPLIARLRPREDHRQQLHSFELNITPTPIGQSQSIDAFGNIVSCAWFGEMHESLSLHAKSDVTTLEIDPFHYYVTDERILVLPANYADAKGDALAPYRRQHHESKTIDSIATELMQTHSSTTDFLFAALQHVKSTCKTIYRQTGKPLKPEETITRGEGACRDIAIVFMEIVRRAGLAARFVSGYHEAEAKEGKRQMHAWAEVYLGSAGWRGYDPTMGLVITPQHIAVAASHDFAHAAATTGTYRGTGVTSSLEFEIGIQSVG